MIHIETIISNLNIIFENPLVLLAIFSATVTIKFSILFFLTFSQSKSLQKHYSYFFLVIVLVSSILQDSEWIFSCLDKVFFSNSQTLFLTFWRRAAWAFTIMLYQSLALFIESLVTERFKFNIHNKIYTTISSLLTIYFILEASINFQNINPANKSVVESLVQKFVSLYLPLPVIISSLIFIYRKLKRKNLPNILKHQIKLLLCWVILPFWLSDLVQIIPFSLSIEFLWLNTSYVFVSLSNILLTYAIFYCSRKMLGLRFLNWHNHVQSHVNINFMENFKTILEQFSQVTSLRELTHITQQFFKQAFDIPFNRVQLHIRATNQHGWQQKDGEQSPTVALVEGFMSTHSKSMCNYIQKNKILVYDELAFSNFYESTTNSQAAASFLDGIQADIFLPIYEKDTLIAYITVDRYARLNNFYTSTEYDEMLIFTRYLGNIIHLMQNKNLDTLIKQEKDLQEELYAKHQEISQYKESIRSFLRNQHQKDIGILFYKNRRFTFANKAASELVPVNPNVAEGHPLSKALKKLAQQVESYKTAQTLYSKDNNGNKLVLSGVPSLEQNNVIISVYYPEVTDVIKKQIDSLQDPSEWDYLLYLETTKPGKLINQLIPGSGETLLNFKIALLKTALSKKATLLDMPEQDLEQMVELLHHVSIRETLHTIDLAEPSDSPDIAIKLFGINRIFDTSKKHDAPLLEKLDGVGTLFIKNIHFLSLETQEHLAEFIRYGFFRIFKSDNKISSNVRIICSTNQNLHALAQEGKFSKALFAELKQTALVMPSLSTLPEHELNTLADGFSEQAVANQTYQNLLSLSDKDKSKLAHVRPVSLQELKQKVQQILVAKSKESDIYHESHFDPAYSVTDPELVEAARLGKKALKDGKIMTLLWQKFKNQNKIASFLGVNRSSVNRRCKQFGLIE